MEKSVFLKIAAQASEAGDFLNIFLRFLGFWGSFSYQMFVIKKNVYCKIHFVNKICRMVKLLMMIKGLSRSFSFRKLYTHCVRDIDYVQQLAYTAKKILLLDFFVSSAIHCHLQPGAFFFYDIFCNAMIMSHHRKKP